MLLCQVLINLELIKINQSIKSGDDATLSKQQMNSTMGYSPQEG
jgi:hypothetical protein